MIEELLKQIIERLDQRYYGKYRGYVSKVADPLNLGRIQARVPRLLGDTPTDWAMPCSPYAGPDQGLFVIPELGAGVWIEFEGGDLSRPIWSGMWWGMPQQADINQSDSTATAAPDTSEAPKLDHPPAVATPGVRMLKSATGHAIILDDRPEDPRIEIADRDGNRLLFSKDGFDQLVSNYRMVNEGNRSSQIDQNDTLDLGGDQTETVAGSHNRQVKGDVTLAYNGALTETVDAATFSRTIDQNGLTQSVAGPKTETISGSMTRKVSGAVDDTAASGYGISAGGSVNIGSGASVSIAAAMGLPNAISMGATLGNISIDSMLGLMQLGGLTAISPMVLGDGIMMHFMMLAQILKAVNPLTAAGYGPMLDVWASLTPLVCWSLFGFVKRFPVG